MGDNDFFIVLAPCLIGHMEGLGNNNPHTSRMCRVVPTGRVNFLPECESIFPPEAAELYTCGRTSRVGTC